MPLPWVEKYRPKSRDELVGNNAAINGLVMFLKKWKRKNKIKSAILIGPAGCGKTSSVYAIANELGYTVTEINASDTRKKNSIKDQLGPASQYISLDSDSEKKIILMDEIDGLSGRYDRGGLSEFIKIVKESRYPVVCTANDPESDKIDKLLRKKYFRVFEFNRLEEFEIFELLLQIAEKENIKVDEVVLERIAAKSSGDIRAAINELESHVSGSSAIQLEERNKMQTLTSLLNNLYRSDTYEEARKVMFNAPSDYYKLLLFLFDETASQCKTPQDLANAYEQIAQADIVYQRIMRTQNWSLLKYFFDYIGPGLVMSRKNKIFKKISKLNKIPSAFIARGRANRILSRASKLAPKVAPQLHISERRFIHEEYPIFAKIFNGPNAAELAARLNLNDKEVEILVKETKNSNLEKNIEEARKSLSKDRIKSGKKSTPSSNPLMQFENLKTMDKTKSQQDEKESFSSDETDQISSSKEIKENDQDKKKDKDDQLTLDDFF